MNSTLGVPLQSALDTWQLFAPCLGANVTIDDSLYGVWQGASGYRDVDRTRMPRHAQSYIYSITKTFTAVRVVQLALSAALSLDDPVTRYLPELPFPAGVTIRRLLNHSAGVPSYTDLAEYANASYGLGLMIDPDFGHGGFYGHGGGGPGFNTWAMYLPDFHGRSLVLVAFCNTTMGGHPVNLVRDLMRVLADAGPRAA